jgi:hypothetical protein
VDSSKAADYFPPVDSCPPQIKNMRQRFENPWYSAQVQIGDSSFMHLTRRDTITAVWKQGKGWLQLDLSSADTSNRIYGVQAYRKYIKPKRWGLGISAGYGAAGDKLAPFVGLSLNYSLIKF